jgi:short-subunit dehydrogenase
MYLIRHQSSISAANIDVDIVVNNAGVGTPQSVLGEDVEKIFAFN